MINQEIKGNLAKLLATENLIVEHKKVPTACFDVERRVLTLPIWNKASSTVYDMLVGHEVGHALYTPNEDWTQAVRNNVPKDFVNVVEDARIEKLMKRKFPGLARSFYGGYKELNDDDFFCVNDEDLSKLSLIDRINLHFKVGAFAMIPFVDDEQRFVTAVADAETFEEVLAICEDLVDFLKQKKEEQTQIDIQPQGQNSDSGAQQGEQQQGDSDQQPEGEQDGEGDVDDSGESESSDGTDDSSDLNAPSYGGNNASGPNEEQSKTQRSFDQKSEGLSTPLPPYHSETVYVEVPKVKLENTIIDCKKLHDYISKQWWGVAEDRKKHWGNIFEVVDSEYSKYKNSAQKEVNYLVKEFECKKSADAYARAATSRTGVLDTTRLHTYKYNEDLFKKVTVLPDGKNHGLIFILDWSGSMNTVILDTVKQLLNLCWFCKKVQIPFEVYGFTYEWNNTYADPDSEPTLSKTDRKIGEFDIHRMFSLLNFLSSRTNNSEFDQQAKHLFRLAYYFTKNTSYTVPYGLDLSGTPLNESIIALHEIIPQFKNTNKLQKVNVVILTDGEGNNLTYNVESSYRPGKLGANGVSHNCVLRDRKTGNVYRQFGHEYKDSLTAILLENLKHRFPEVNLIGFRIIGGSEFNRFYRELMGIRYGADVPDSVSKTWRKEKSYEINPVGYDALYAISSSGLSSDASFDVSDNASTTEIRKAFKGMLKQKTTNKKLLSSFASLVS